MNISDFLTVLALILNASALFYAGYQIKLNKRSLELAQQAIDHQRRVQQMDLLPLANYLFSGKK